MSNTLSENTNPPTVSDPFNYEAHFKARLDQINQALDDYLTPNDPTAPNYADGLWQAMRYSTLNGGKRIRAVMAIETCLACGGEPDNILPTACAIELVHAQSLIHDDLPCMDDDDLRRGKPTLHKAFDEATAVLTGDALIAMAFGLIVKHTPSSQRVTPETIGTVVSDFADVASIRGLVNGQYVDIQCEGKAVSGDVLEYIHSYKTGALFGFSTRAGAKLAGADDALVETMTRFGQTVGLAFQIVDDLLDIQSNAETLGKTVGKDQDQQKATYPALYGEAVSKEKVQELTQQAKALLGNHPQIQVDSLLRLADFISVRVH